MPVYKEQEDKLTFNLADTDEEVTITLTDYQGTRVSVSYGFPPKRVNNDSPNGVVGTYATLKGKTITFTGSANNPLENNNRVKHTIQRGTQVLDYTFSDDYTGAPDYEDTSGNISYQFKVKFD